MNKLLAGMKNEGRTANGARQYNSTLDGVMDMFALGAAYRNRSDADVLFLFQKAWNEDKNLALKCLFYIRDILEGQGERRFFRVCMTWLGNRYPDLVAELIPEIVTTGIGRWDDLYALVDTRAERAAMTYFASILMADFRATTHPSLAGKWAKSVNCSSNESRRLGRLTAQYCHMSEPQYRRMLANLRKRINIVERLMSQGKWDEIEFDKLPSHAGLQYKAAFKLHCGKRYEEFASNKETKVNAKALYPYDVVKKARELPWNCDITDRQIVNKYWDNLTDYFNGMTLNALAVCDTSGSMTWSGGSTAPIDVAISLALYCAERANGPFANHYISFSRIARLIETKGVDFVEKVDNIYRANLCENTNLDNVFKLVLETAYAYNLKQSDLPETLIIISDMQVDEGSYQGHIMDYWREKYRHYGYTMPKLVWWNVNASQDTILDRNDGATLVSGASPVIFEMILSGKTGRDLMLEKLNSKRYERIHV